VAFPFHAVNDGDRLPLGNVVVDVIHTPGHTPEHICLLVTDRTRAEGAVVRSDRPYPDGRRCRPDRTC
jgi:glyoxylase-like metal-dependent hydrolase (beta-lactamase superfamily II)